MNDDDDDDVWCNPEDEDNLKHCVQIDQERIEQLREILGQETLQMILDHCHVSEIFYSQLLLNFCFYSFDRKMKQIFRH